MFRTFIAALTLMFLLSGPSTPGMTAAVVERFHLKNGLQVRLRPIGGADKVAVVVFFHIGGNQDPPGRSGLAHLVEHLYVTSAAGNAPSRTAEEWMAAGGANAQTGENDTLVADVTDANRVDAALQDAASRMGALRMEPAILERERQRVLLEVSNMFGGLPALGAFNLARERVRPTPLGGRRGGAPAQVRTISQAEVQEWWRRYYKPVNATLVITGRFEPGAMRSAIQEYFGPLQAGIKAPEPRQPGPPNIGGLTTLRVSAIQPGGAEVCLVYRAPPPGSRDYAPFLLLLTRLSQHAGDLGVNLATRFPPPIQYALIEDPSVIGIGAPLQIGETDERAVARLQQFVSAQAASPFRKSELTAVRDMVGPFLGLVDVPDDQWARNPYALALVLLRSESAGLKPAKLNHELNSLNDADLQRCARSVFAPHRAASVIVVPTLSAGQ